MPTVAFPNLNSYSYFVGDVLYNSLITSLSVILFTFQYLLTTYVIRANKMHTFFINDLIQL